MALYGTGYQSVLTLSSDLIFVSFKKSVSILSLIGGNMKVINKAFIAFAIWD